jgi:hypothetical protein
VADNSKAHDESPLSVDDGRSGHVCQDEASSLSVTEDSRQATCLGSIHKSQVRIHKSQIEITIHKSEFKNLCEL